MGYCEQAAAAGAGCGETMKALTMLHISRISGSRAVISPSIPVNTE